MSGGLSRLAILLAASALAATVVGAAAPVETAAPVVVTPVADTYVHASAPRTAYGLSTSLAAYGSPSVTSFLRFAVPAVPTGQRLAAASLRLRSTSIPSAGSTNDQLVQLANDTWQESSVTYISRPAVAGDVLGTLRSPGAISTAYDVQVNPAALQAAAGATVTLAVLGTGSDSFWFVSREATATQRPRLSLTFEPVPATDTTAPSTPADLAASPGASSVSLSWTPATDDVGVTGYEVHRSADAGFTPDSSTLVGNPSTASWTDSPVAAGTWNFRVVAKDAAGNVSSASAPATATVPPPATTRTLTPAADSYVHSTQPDSRYGSSTSMGVYGSPAVTSLMRFGLPAAPAGQGLTRATLRLRTTSIPSAGSGDRVDLLLAGDTWSESTVTWNTRPPVGTTVLGSVRGAAPSSEYDTGLDEDVLGARLGSSVTLALQGTGTDSLWIVSREAAASARPLLTLEFATTGPPDTTDPGAPAALEASATGADVSLRWTAAQDDRGVAGYDMHRSRSPGFSPTPETLVATPASVTYLDPGRGVGDWYYRVVARDGAGNRGPATPQVAVTVGGSTEPVSVMLVGDIACAPGSPVGSASCRHGDVAEVVRTNDPDRFVPVGDIQYANATLAQFTGTGAYDTTFGSLRTVTLPVVGNHEHTDPSGPAEGYFDYFTGAGSDRGPFGARPDGYYEQTIGSWQFIALNSECLPDAGNAGRAVPGGCEATSPQYRWLERILVESPSTCTLVAMHRPRWTTGAGHPSYAPLGPIWDLLVANGVDVVVSGHNHSTEVFARIGASGAATTPLLDPDGIRSFVAGGGGHSHYGFASSGASTALQARDSTTFGALKLTLHDGSFDWGFLPVAGQSFTGQGTSGAFAGTGESCR